MVTTDADTQTPGAADAEYVHVVEVADDLFYRRGIHAVGMDAIRSAAAVPLKRLYGHFPSKDALLAAVLEHRSSIWDAGIAQAAASAGTPRARLLAVYDFLDGWFRQDDFRGCGFINAFGEMGVVSPRVAEIARGHKQRFQRYVADLVADLGGPPELADQLAILAEGAQTTAAISGTPVAAERARAAAATLIDAALATAARA